MASNSRGKKRKTDNGATWASDEVLGSMYGWDGQNVKPTRFRGGIKSRLGRRALAHAHGGTVQPSQTPLREGPQRMTPGRGETSDHSDMSSPGLSGQDDHSSPSERETSESDLCSADDEDEDEDDEADADGQKADGGREGKGTARANNTITCRWRCLDCLGRAHFCGACVSKYHRLNPFHRLLRWNPGLGYWEKRAMADHGHVLCYGHGKQMCPERTSPPRELVIVHAGGVTQIKLAFCECKRAALRQLAAKYDREEALQLIDMGLYPGSWQQPRTAFTQDVLRSANLLTLQGGISTQDFYTYLKRTTNNVAPDLVPDRYREMMRSQREYDFLRACKRAGVHPTRNLAPRSLVVSCPACPQPGKNMRLGWETRRPDLRYMDALFYSVDGNFRQKQREKPMDYNDIPLTEGAAYFVDAGDLSVYMRKIGPAPKVDTTCHKFASMGYGGYTGKVTGTVALTCRHLCMLPSSVVDLIGDENQAYVDFCVHFYDINCQYMKIVDELRTISSTALPEVQGAVGKLHVNGHIPFCRIFQSPNFVPGCGREDGEGSERMWFLTNPMASRTQEMTTGHRHDTITHHISDLNVRQVHKMPQVLVKKWQLATKNLAAATRYLEKVEKDIPEEDLEAWRDEEAEWLALVTDMANHKDMSNPYSATGTEGNRGDVRGVGMVGAIERMMDLEQQREDLRGSIRNVDRSKRKQRAAITKKVDNFLLEVDLAMQDYDRHVTPSVTEAYEAARACIVPDTEKAVEEPLDDDHLDSLLASVNEVVLCLPSLYHSSLRGHASLKTAIEIERRIREGQANDALDNLRTHLAARYSLRDLRAQGKGPKHGKKVRALAQVETKIGTEAKQEYRRLRVLLRVLGMAEDDDKYKVLRDDDLKHFVAVTEQYELGSGSKTGSWLWGDFTFVNKQGNEEVHEFLMRKLKPHWFRSRANMTRWAEEVNLKQEEMYRTLQMFRYEMTRWDAEGEAEDEAGRAGYAACARK
ncbi:hypothetical protein C8Q70DRAFT_1046552 [Cubamyces menziesii]|nr:hypothetical protein C8Q70DRAFT_1046552 [Cubamyces menziesii]